jgi:hypothetical protein
MSVSVDNVALLKATLHAAAHPAATVLGVLLGTAGGDGGSTRVADALPLFHCGAGLAPMLEVALAQATLATGVTVGAVTGRAAIASVAGSLPRPGWSCQKAPRTATPRMPKPMKAQVSGLSVMGSIRRLVGGPGSRPPG